MEREKRDALTRELEKVYWRGNWEGSKRFLRLHFSFVLNTPNKNTPKSSPLNNTPYTPQPLPHLPLFQFYLL